MRFRLHRLARGKSKSNTQLHYLLPTAWVRTLRLKQSAVRSSCLQHATWATSLCLWRTERQNTSPLPASDFLGEHAGNDTVSGQRRMYVAHSLDCTAACGEPQKNTQL